VVFAAQCALGVVVASAEVACGDLRVADVPATDEAGRPIDSDGSTSGGDGAVGGDGAAVDGGADAAKDSSVVCDGPCPPEVLVSGLSQATAITVDANNVYFGIESGNGTVYQCPKTGCKGAPIELGPGYATSIVVAGGLVYWGDFAGAKLVSCAVGGCAKAPTSVVSNQMQMKGVVTDDVDLFWAADGVIRRCPRATCSTATAQDITTGQGFVQSMAAEQGKVIWPDNNKINICPAAGACGTPTVLGPGSGDVSIRSGRAYWVNGTAKTVVMCPLTGCAGGPITIGSSSEPRYPVSDGVNVYWRDGFLDQIYRCPSGGCLPSPTVLATKQRGQPGGQIALDGEYVYWTTASTVVRLRK